MALQRVAAAVDDDGAISNSGTPVIAFSIETCARPRSLALIPRPATGPITKICGAAAAGDATRAEPRKAPSGNFVYVASRDGNAIYQIDANQILDRVPCNGSCPVVASGFNEAFGLAFTATGTLLVTDSGNDVVYSITGLP